MDNYRSVKEFREPEEIFQTMIEEKSEMIDSEIGFLCGLIKEKRPHKILEVGVAAGGTTVAILNCVHLLGQSCEMFSLDLSEKYYRDNIRPTGFMVNELNKSILDTCKHQFILGKTLPERIEEIGGEIDFLILDTTHVMPGEVLDFIVALPYLAEHAVVVIHDTNFQFQYDMRDGIATSVLFQSVVADKYLNNQEFYPNIVAFEINNETKKYIVNVFLSLMTPWTYIPDRIQSDACRSVIERFYDEQCLKIYEQAYLLSEKLIQREEKLKAKKLRDIEIYSKTMLSQVNINRKLLIYGMGKRGKCLWKIIENQSIDISGFILSDGQPKDCIIGDKPIYYFSEIPFSKEDTLIILAIAAREVEEKLEKSGYVWAKISEENWTEIEKK